MLKHDTYLTVDGPITIVSVGVGESQIFGAVDKGGKIVIPIIYDFLYHFRNSVCIAKNRKFKEGHINSKGEIITPMIFTNVNPFDGNTAKVWINSGEGFVDKKGKVIDGKKSLIKGVFYRHL